MGDFWVFGYGSLMWKPGFDFLEKRPATLPGLHRSLCIFSWVHRGTRENPGLVFGLDRGGSCRGIAYKVASANRQAVIDYLRARELVTNVYLEQWRTIELAEGEAVGSLVYVVDRDHEQYAGKLPLWQQLEIVRKSIGKSGANDEYVLNTIQHLQESGITDPDLDWLHKELEAWIGSVERTETWLNL